VSIVLSIFVAKREKRHEKDKNSKDPNDENPDRD